MSSYATLEAYQYAYDGVGNSQNEKVTAKKYHHTR
jgi:hypothetical protein